ncbi:hypothetical protein AAC387_Pa01g3187 [Persea americana]
MEDGGYGKGFGSHQWPSDWNGFLPTSFVNSSSSCDDGRNLRMLYGGGENGQQVMGGGGENVHLTCLNLGKRHYFEDGGEALGGKRGRGTGYYQTSSSSSSSSSAVPRCQVEGCHVTLTDAKDYHRRHKVCEAHSKAPKVVVLGVEQRFCQQCSRFHVVSEFDDSKRSCRRRLAGHNERRRKSANEFIARNPSQENSTMDHRFPSISSMTGCALSLLSSKTSWISSADLSSRSSAALRELIAENRAKVLAKQLFSDGDLHYVHNSAAEAQGYLTHSQHNQFDPDRSEACRLLPSWNHFHEPSMHVTLDLMQTPESSFGFMSGRSRPKEEEEECCAIWKSLEDTHVYPSKPHCGVP